MSALKRLCVVLTVVAGAAMVASTPAAAQWHHHHGYRHHGGGFYFGFGAPYAYAPGPYYYGPACRWERVRYWRYGRWHWRSVRRCY